jgi:predicted N-acetyltransferase YhbS
MVMLMEGPRALKHSELGSLIQLTNRVFRPDGGDMGSDFGYFLRKDNVSNLRVFVDNDTVQAHCGWRPYQISVRETQLKVGCIGAVCCAPEVRGQGLASRLFQDSIVAMRAAGADFVLVSGTRGLYTRNAAVTWGAATEWLYQAGDEASLNSDNQDGLEVALASHDCAEKLAELYNAEQIRFVRPASEWTEIIEGRWCMNRAAKLFVIKQYGQTVAYCAVRLPGREDKSGATLFLGEYAGCRASLIKALPVLASKAGLKSLRVPVASWDAGLATELSRSSLLQQDRAEFSGTVKLVNFPQLMKHLASYMLERGGDQAAELICSESAGKFEFALAEQKLVLSEEDACRIIFGTPDGEEKQLLNNKGQLGKVLSAALPIELPNYGFSYV